LIIERKVLAPLLLPDQLVPLMRVPFYITGKEALTGMRPAVAGQDTVRSTFLPGRLCPSGPSSPPGKEKWKGNNIILLKLSCKRTILLVKVCGPAYQQADIPSGLGRQVGAVQQSLWL
jgi:hypothetical protein